MRASSRTMPVKAGWLATSCTFLPSSHTSRPSLRLSMYLAPVIAPSAVVVSNTMPSLLPRKSFRPDVQPSPPKTMSRHCRAQRHDYTPGTQRMRSADAHHVYPGEAVSHDGQVRQLQPSRSTALGTRLWRCEPPGAHQFGGLPPADNIACRQWWIVCYHGSK